MVGDAANLPHIERLMSPFFVSRNVGLKLDRTLAGERMTLSLGYGRATLDRAGLTGRTDQIFTRLQWVY